MTKQTKDRHASAHKIKDSPVPYMAAVIDRSDPQLGRSDTGRMCAHAAKTTYDW